MRKRHDIRPDCQLVEGRLVDVVRGIESDHTRQERPGSERARREPGYVCGLLDGRVDGGGIVDARRVAECRVGLD